MSYVRAYLNLLGATLTIVAVFALFVVPWVAGSWIQYGILTWREPTSPAIWAGIIVSEIFIMPAAMVMLGWATRTFGGESA